jgi:hypothetical protein
MKNYLNTKLTNFVITLNLMGADSASIILFGILHIFS